MAGSLAARQLREAQRTRPCPAKAAAKRTTVGNKSPWNGLRRRTFRLPASPAFPRPPTVPLAPPRIPLYLHYLAAFRSRLASYSKIIPLDVPFYPIFAAKCRCSGRTGALRAITQVYLRVNL